MKTQMIVFFGLVCLAYVNAAAEGSNDTAVLSPSGDVKPVSQKVDNQELSKEDVKSKINDAVDTAKDKIEQAKQKVADAASDASDKAKEHATAVSDKLKEGADAIKDKVKNSATSNFGFSAFATSMVMLALARL